MYHLSDTMGTAVELICVVHHFAIVGGSPRRQTWQRVGCSPRDWIYADLAWSRCGAPRTKNLGSSLRPGTRRAVMGIHME